MLSLNGQDIEKETPRINPEGLQNEFKELFSKE